MMRYHEDRSVIAGFQSIGSLGMAAMLFGWEASVKSVSSWDVRVLGCSALFLLVAARRGGAATKHTNFRADWRSVYKGLGKGLDRYEALLKRDWFVSNRFPSKSQNDSK